MPKGNTYFHIQSIGDIYQLVLESAGYDRFSETREYLNGYISGLRERADYTSQRLSTDLDSYEATLDEQRALLLDILGELEELERGDLTKSNLIRRIAKIRTIIDGSL